MCTRLDLRDGKQAGLYHVGWRSLHASSGSARSPTVIPRSLPHSAPTDWGGLRQRAHADGRDQGGADCSADGCAPLHGFERMGVRVRGVGGVEGCAGVDLEAWLGWRWGGSGGEATEATWSPRCAAPKRPPVPHGGPSSPCVEMVERHKKARAAVTDDIVDAFMAVRPMPWDQMFG